MRPFALAVWRGVMHALDVALAQIRLGFRLIPDWPDLHVYGGGALVFIGVSAWSPAAALVVAGTLLTALGLMISKPWR